MSSPLKRLAPWLIVLLLVLAAGAWWLRSGTRQRLPALVTYPNLPTAFNDLLAARHRAAKSGAEDAVRQLARLYQANRLFPEARSAYEVLARAPAHFSAEDRYFLADLALAAGDLAAAQAELRTVLQANPAYLPARITLADSLFKSGEEAAAATEYEAILARMPDQPQAMSGLARLALQRGDDATALAKLERVLATHPEVTSAAALLAQVLDRRGDKERAEALTASSRRTRDPLVSDPWLEALLADCYDPQRLALRFEELVYAGQFAEAQPLLARVEQLDPNNWLPHLLRGWTLAKARRDADAVPEFQRALEKSGDVDRVVPLLVQSLLTLNRPADARLAVERALAAKSDSVGLLTMEADLAVRAGDKARARGLLEKLLQREPYLYLANMNLTQLLWETGEKDAAVQCLLRVAKAFPVDVASRGLLGQYYIEKENFAAAVPPLEQALPQAEAGSPARERLAGMLTAACLRAGAQAAQAGRPADAAAYFEKAGRLSVAGVEALGQLAGELAQARQFQPAADALTRLAALQPANPTVQISLGDMLYQAGDPAAAHEHWEKARSGAAPGDAALREALETRLSGRITPELFN